MYKPILVLIIALLSFYRPACAANVTSDASLKLGIPVATQSSGNTAAAPWVRDRCSADTLWQLVPDLWAVNSNATGSLTMQYTGTGSIVTTVNLSNLTLSGVNAYPFVFYGADPWGNRMSGQPLTFPAKISSMSSLFVDVDYHLSITGTAPGDQDIGFDEWIVPYDGYGGGYSGALEVLVVPYFKFAWAPAGKLVGTFTEPVSVNGVNRSMVFNEYSTGVGPGHEIIFLPRDSQISSGDVRLNLLDFIRAGAALGQIDSSWLLAGINFGTEFGNTKSAQFTFTTNKISIEQNLIP